MLKALELVGFKSFADKTRFEFDRGITVVVGPNGSGKSNVVDGIKWVLGEQSVKSLRGTEMVDVIFNGSATRRPLNSAETTLVFDNSDHRLPIEAGEVHITRRVYRSGEGEYLINRQPCRLRDIRDLFAGTGAATEAYSVIEQGKVDVLLQSSPRDRRIIFEEAAGISRFKAKKIEALRRLERVEQNLLRLSDIVDEVESRLRGVRQQASKARRYQELTGRLRDLRLGISLADWRKLTALLTAAEAQLTALRDQINALSGQAEAVEARGLQLDTHIADHDEQLRAAEARLADNRSQLAALQSTIEHQRAFGRDLESQAARHRRQLATHNVRAGDVEEQYQAAVSAAKEADDGRRLAMKHVAEHERAMTALTAQFDQIRDENHQRRASLLEETRAAAALANEIGSLESQLALADSARQSNRLKLEELTAGGQSLTEELAGLQTNHDQLAADVSDKSTALATAQQRLADERRRQQQRQKELTALSQRGAATAERVRLLEELEQRQEGVGAGVREVLSLVKDAAPGPLAAVRGILADLLQVDVAMAPLVELALAERAQSVVLTPGQNAAEFVQLLLSQADKLTGRVGFLATIANKEVESAGGAAHGASTDNKRHKLLADPGVVGRVTQFVQSAPEYATLIDRLLGHIWIVKTLSDALRLAAVVDGPAQFITASGEVLHADGSLSVGPPQSSAGLISRRSELRKLAQQLADHQRRHEALEQQLATHERQLAEQDRDLLELSAEHQQKAEQLAELRMKLAAAGERLSRHQQQCAAVEQAGREAEEQWQGTSAALATARQTAAKRDLELQRAEMRINENAHRIAQLEQLREERGRETMTAKVELARREQQLSHLQAQLAQCEHDRQERHRAIADGSQQLDQLVDRIRESEDRILSAESQLAELYLQKESVGATTVRLVNAREDHRREKTAAQEQGTTFRAQVRRLEDQWRTADTAAGHVRHERAAIAQRMQEDYAVDLATYEQESGATKESGVGSRESGVKQTGPDGPKAADVDVSAVGSQTAAPVDTPDSGLPTPDSALTPDSRLPTPDSPEARAAAEEEIAEIRRKLGNIGNVNLDSLAEAEQLEARFESLNNQFQDLSKAKAALQQIVGKINADSRRLFAETLETVRGHFQELFKKLFGGGQADIILDQGADILETGIEIVARPPGKEPRNISLLSGGEKTMTCVALLLAIFRSRPSPFCVLDEVDAALDEANTERFVAVLREFLAWTRFIIVTHSKKTMTAANTLYGVTMQESGVSKRVSVRFDDVSENGEIRDSSASDPPSRRAA